MSASRNRVFVDSGVRSEEAGNKIAVGSFGGDDNPEAVIIKLCFGFYLLENRKIGIDTLQRFFAIYQYQKIYGLINGDRLYTKCFFQKFDIPGKA